VEGVNITETAIAVGTVVLAIATIVLALATRTLAKTTSHEAQASREMVEENRELVRANREMVAEMKASRVAQERPQVRVDADYRRSPLVNVVVRNIGKGAAKNITFHFSAPLESSLSAKEHSVAVPLNELPYFKEGMDFLAPGAEYSSAWDSLISLKPLLRNRGLERGITITSRYESLGGDVYETPWTINPLLMESYEFPEKGVVDAVGEVASELGELASTLNSALDSTYGELRVSTDAERRRRREDVATGGKYKHMDQVKVKRGEDLVLNGQVHRYLGGGLYLVFVAGQGAQRVVEQDLSPRLEDVAPGQGDE
jgi:hypothetical protein